MNHGVAFFVFNLTTYSGAARQALTLADHLTGFTPTFFNVERGRRALEVTVIDGHTTVHLPDRRLAAIMSIVRYTRQNRIRVFHLHGLVGVGLLAGLLLRKPIVLKTTLLGSDDFDSLRRKRFGRLLMWLIRRVDVNVVLSRALEDINRRYLPAARVHRLPNGAKVLPAGRAKDTPSFVVVGLVCHRKRTRTAIEVFLNTYAQSEGAVLYVIGPTGEDYGLEEGDHAYYQDCLSLIPENRAAQVVFTGPLSPAELTAYYQAALGFLSFSEAEGMPNAMLEAMAANCVPVVGEIGGVAREIVDDGKDGFIVHPGSAPPSLEEVRRLSATHAPQRRIAEAFSLTSLGEKYTALYRELL